MMALRQDFGASWLSDEGRWRRLGASRELDPRTVLGIAFVFVMLGVVMNKPLPSHILLVICNLLLLETRAYRDCILYSLVYVVIVVLLLHIHRIPNSTVALMIVSLSYFVQKFSIAMMMVAFLKRKTSMPCIISAMQTMRCPNVIAIPLIVVFRYIPVLKENHRCLKDSLRIRGIRASGVLFFIHPVRSLELMIVPILFRSIRVAEELSISALLRGIENYRERTNIHPLRFTRRDFAYVLFMVIAVGALCCLQFNDK